MIEQRFGPRRCRDSKKPLAGQCPEVEFSYCDQCHRIFATTGGSTGTAEIVCCGVAARALVPLAQKMAADQIAIEYQITGGYNDNAIKISWRSVSQEYYPQWVYLKTFTGGYLKYIGDNKRSSLVFALADTDAFAYCDADPCLECVFRCKRGFVIYVYVAAVGLIELPIDKMTAHWQSEKM